MFEMFWGVQALSGAIAADEIESIRGAAAKRRRAQDHSVLDSSCGMKSRRRRSADADVDSSSGWFAQARAANAHAGFVRFCDVKAVSGRSDAAASASNNGASGKHRRATAHAVLAISYGSLPYDRRGMAAADIAGRRGTCTKSKAAQDHDMFAKPCGPY